MFAISPTDKSWFDFLKDSGLNSNVNFWTPTPWNLKRLSAGDRLYFMLKAPIRLIGGYGQFAEYKNLTAAAAWNEFGYGNGRDSRGKFINSIKGYLDKNSSKFGGKTIDINTYEIGCVVLDNCVFWEEDQYVNPADYNIDFASAVVKTKYYPIYDPFKQASDERNNFSLVEEPRDDDYRITKTRYGQSEFKGKLLRVYNNTCCISGETIPELLEAAHIQEYRSRSSNHIQNGLLFRVDIHRLYDNRLIYIDEHYTVYVSRLVTNPMYRQYHGQKIILPSSVSDYPSVTALKSRLNEFRD